MIGVRVQGLDRVVRDLKRLGVEVEDLRAAFTKIGQEAVPIYQAVTPRKTGRLAGSYRASRARNKAVLYVGSAAVPYAAAIQYGYPARNIAARRYVEQGDRVAAPQVTATLDEEVTRLIQRLDLD